MTGVWSKRSSSALGAGGDLPGTVPVAAFAVSLSSMEEMMSRSAELFRPTSPAFLGALAAVLVATTFPVTAAARDTAPTDAKTLQRVVDEAYEKFKDLKEGANANYIPILDTVPSDLYGVAIVTKDGDAYTAGDVDYIFAIESVAKPFNAALVMQEQGPEAVREKIGVEPTGLPFNSKLALEIYEARSVNPLVNAGAIAAVTSVSSHAGTPSSNDSYTL